MALFISIVHSIATVIVWCPQRPVTMPLHLEKKAIRVLGVAESFRPREKHSTLVGIVMRSDLIVDGIAIGRLTVSGTDAARSILELFRKLGRNDVNAIIISGSVLSVYNVLDITEIYKVLSIPVVALSFHRAKSDLYRNVKEKFSSSIAKEKLRLLEKLGSSRRLKLNTGYSVFIRSAGIQDSESARLLNKFTFQGSVPEPVKVARLFAKSVATLSNRIKY